MVIIKVHNGTVVQRWAAGDRLDDLQARYPSDDLRQVPSTVFCGMTDNGDGTYSAPPPKAPTDEEMEREDLDKARHLAMRTLIKLGKDINQHDNTILSAEVKQNLQTLLALLRT